LRMQALVIMSLLAQLDVFQPKFFLNLSHWKARLPGEEKSVPNNLRPPENSLWSRGLRRNTVLVVHRILTSVRVFRAGFAPKIYKNNTCATVAFQIEMIIRGELAASD
jgi:hypothetical protein